MKLDEALKHFGGVSRLSEAIGVYPNTISMWKARGNVIPKMVQFQIELGTNGALKADEPALLTQAQQLRFRAQLAAERKEKRDARK